MPDEESPAPAPRVDDGEGPDRSADADPALDQRFVSVMGGVAAPVVVVTSRAGDRPHGTTVSAFASLSRRPPMITVALDRGSELLAQVEACGRFGINVLSHDQSELALSFARKGSSRFDNVAWELADGMPRLQGTTGWLVCEVATIADGGDHRILLGTVVAAEDTAARPLVYHRRTFGTHASLDGDESAGTTAAVPPAAREAAAEPLVTTYGEALEQTPLALMGLA